MSELDRAVLAPRRPWRRRMLVVAGASAAASLQVIALALLVRPRAPRAIVVPKPMFAEAHVVAVCAPAPVAPVAPTPPPPVIASVPPDDAGAQRACPPPRTDAPRLTPGMPDEHVDRITVAPSNAGWVAAWNDAHVFVSTDAGAHFARVLDGPGAVSDVGFDCFGTVAVVRGQQLGVRTGDDERWSAVPGVELRGWPVEGEDRRGHAAIVSGGPEIVIVGRQQAESWAPRLARTDDLGAHWRYHDVEADWEQPVVHGRQREDGTIAIAVPATDCAGEGTTIVRVRRGALTTALGGWWPFPGQRVDDDARPAGLPEDAVWAGEELARAGDALYRVRGMRATRLRVVAEAEHAYVRDAAGRVWTVHCGVPIIAGPRPSAITCEAEADEPDAGSGAPPAP